jgi:hypothetical protein
VTLSETLIRRPRTFPSKGLACARYMALRDRHGDDHPATRAALGRLNYYLKMVPQQDSVTPEAIAWRRESGAAPGYRNRTHRRQPCLSQ